MKKMLFILMSIVIMAMLNASYSQAKMQTAEESLHADLDGDGMEDTIKIRYKHDWDELYGVAKVYINGRLVKTFKNSPMGYEREILKLENGKRFLYFRTVTFDDDGEFRLYRYDGKKLKCLINFNKVYGCRWVRKIKVKGNKIIANMEDSDAAGLGYMSFRSIYSYKGGFFKLNSKTHKIRWYCYWDMDTGASKKGIFGLNTNKRFKIYSDRKCKHCIGKVPLGTLVKVTKTYRTGTGENGYATFYVTGMGYKGWYTSKDVEFGYLFEGVSGVA